MIIFKNNIKFLYFWSVFSLPGSVRVHFPISRYGSGSGQMIQIRPDPDPQHWHNYWSIWIFYCEKMFNGKLYTPLLFKVPVCGGRLFTVDTSSRTLQNTQLKLKEEYLVWWIKQGFKLETFIIVMFVCFHSYIFVLYVYAYV